MGRDAEREGRCGMNSQIEGAVMPRVAEMAPEPVWIEPRPDAPSSRVIEGKNLRDSVGGIGGRLYYWEYAERVRKAMKWNVPSINYVRGSMHLKAALICGGGPSLKASIPAVRELQRRGGIVITVNKTHDHFQNPEWLESCAGHDPTPIKPWGHVVLDPMPWVADYIARPLPGVKYFVASSCNPSVMRKLRLGGGECYLWHAGADFYGVPMPHEILQREFPNKPWGIVVGPTTVGLRSVILGYDLGFRMFHLLGFDSSMAKVNGEFKLHAYEKTRPVDSNEGLVTLHTKIGDYSFYTNDHMGRQATDFEDLIEQIYNHIVSGRWEPVDLRVHGDGLLPCYAASIGLHADEAMNREFQGVKEDEKAA